MAVPDDMPEPTASGFREALEERIMCAVTVSRGGAFILFTSYDLLNKVHASLAPELARQGLTALKQGATGRHALLAHFRKEGNAKETKLLDDFGGQGYARAEGHA